MALFNVPPILASNSFQPKGILTDKKGRKKDYLSRKKRFISLKYQILVALVASLILSFATFYFTARGIIVADKKLLIRDLNLALMDGTYGAVTKSIVQRATDLVQVVATGQIGKDPTPQQVKEFFAGFHSPVDEEVFRVIFLKKLPSGSFEKFAAYVNDDLVKKKGFNPDFFQRLDLAHPMDLSGVLNDKSVSLSNFSGSVNSAKGSSAFYGISMMVPARAADKEESSWLARVDLDQSFLVRTLAGSDVSDIFLINRNGELLSHSDAALLLNKGVFDHPLVEKLQGVTQQSESLDIKVGDEEYMASIREAGFPGLYLVSQIPSSEVFRSMRQLFRTTAVSASLILYLAFIGSLFFANRLTADMKRLAFAAKKIGQGNFDIELKPTKEDVVDEVSQLSVGFETMAQEIQNLIAETAEKSRMENELKTVSLLQSTVLSAPDIKSPDLDMSSCYLPATECSGDFLDGFLVGRMLYMAVADATGHGASAALVTGVAKSCLLTLRIMNPGEAPTPDGVLTSLNRVIFQACQGNLLMTMCLVRLDLDTGELLVANAGHESPLCLRKESLASPKAKPEEFFSRGERLGFAADSTYTCETFSMSDGDSLLLYTDGITEAKNSTGQEWGERQVKKAFSKALVASSELPVVRDTMLTDLRAFIGDEPLHDDVTFSLLRLQRQAAAA
jgi:serine phosphatase RsbU (regulator of sigma subunit)